MAKTKISGIVDNSTMGLNIGTEITISKKTSSSLRKAMYNAVTNGLTGYKAKFELVSGNPTKGNCIYILTYAKSNGEENSIRYEFKEQNSIFLNVTGNPTCVVSGSNDIPVLIVGDLYGQHNAATTTFKYLNRVLYAILDTLLAEYGFRWEGVDKKRFVDGDINVQRYQIAWYSGNLGEQREDIMRFLRTCFGSQDASASRVVNIGKEMGISARVWDNHSGNITLEAKYKDNKRSFSLTLYSKDTEPGYIKASDRLSKLIRWDCTLNHQFLQNNSMRTIRDIEKLYVSVCDDSGYDIGFVKFLSSKIEARLQLSYILGLTVSDYRKSIQILEDIDTKSIRAIVKPWLEYNPIFGVDNTAQDIAKHFGIDPRRFSEIKKTILQLSDLDIGIPRSTHEAILMNRVNATMSLEDRGKLVTSSRCSNNRVSWDELVERDASRMKVINDTLDSAGGMLKVRKLKPKRIRTENFWIYRKESK